MTHHQTINSEIAELVDRLETLRQEGLYNASAFTRSFPERASLVDRIERLRAERERMALATAIHSPGDLGDNWTRSAGIVEFTVKVAAIIGVVAGLAFLMSRCTV